MARKYRKKTLVGAIEGVYAQDANPTGAANAIETVDLEISEFEGPTEQMDVDRPTLGNSEIIHVGIYSVLRFKVRVAGSGDPVTPPAWGVLFRMCGHSETIDATVGFENVKYQPISSNEESGSLYFNMDGTLHKLLGARGNVEPALGPGAIPYWAFEIWGLRVPVTSDALPTVDYSAYQPPIPVNDANTPTFTLHGFAANLINFSWNAGMKLTYRNVVGDESVQIVDRSPSGQVTIEEPALGTKDFHAIAENHTKGALAFEHGQAAGAIVAVDMPAVQLLKPRYVDSDGIVGLQMDMNILPVSGDDEWVVTTK